MADATYQPKVYRKSGGDALVVASGGVVEVESGGTLRLDDGAVIESTAGVYTVVTPDDVGLELSTGSSVIQLKDGGITSAKIGTSAVETANINDGAVTTAKLGAGAVDNAALGTRVVAAANIAAAASGAEAVLLHKEIVLPNSTAPATPVDTTFPYRLRVVDVTMVKTGGTATNSTVLTAQVLTSTNGEISNAMNLKVVDKTVVRAGTMNDALWNVGSSTAAVVRVTRAGSTSTVATDNSAIVDITYKRLST